VGRQILWRATGCDPDDPSTWTEPVIRLWDHPEEPFRAAVNAPVLHEAFDQLPRRKVLSLLVVRDSGRSSMYSWSDGDVGGDTAVGVHIGAYAGDRAEREQADPGR
jgi:hypothetical protein